MSTLALLPLNIIPLPGELVQINVEPKLQQKLIEDIYSQGKTFGIFYNHFMNINQLAAQVELVGTTLSDSPTGKDLWVKGLSIYTMSRIYCNSSDPMDLSGEILREHQWTNADFGSKIEDDIKNYLQTYPNGIESELENNNETKVFDVLRLMQLSDSEKFYALNLRNEKDLYLYVVNSLRLKASYYKQKSSIDEPWFLN